MNVGSGTLPAPTLRKDSAAAQVRDFRPKDKEAVLSLFSEILGRSQGQAMAERWRWLFQDCPSPEKPPFLVTQSHGVVIDVLATFSTPGLWQGKEIPMFCVANFLVHPAHRGVGLPLAKAMVDLPHLLVGMPNSDSAILWTHLGSKDLGRPAIFTRVLEFDALKTWISNPILGLLLPAGALLEAALRVTLPSSQSYTIEAADDFPLDCNELWMQVVREGLNPKAPGRGISLVTQRDHRFLHWRFVQCPGPGYHILIARRDGKLAGYAVLRVAEKKGLRRGYLVDLLARPDLPSASAALLQAAETWFRKNGAKVIPCLAANLPSPWKKQLGRHGYWVRTRSFLLMANPNFPGLPGWASEEAVFRHVSYADGELDFVA